ncbi:hypothetical protein ACQKIE_09765, partial [Luteibacter sp. NPDC031894]|uniref:hypothetical protein n=1 Tax=Luteibacter sp. NPDC031894 TaxID=3390572 RepID=UPI003D081535
MSTMTLDDIRELLESAQASGNLSRVTLHVTRVRQAVESLNGLIAQQAAQPAEQPRGDDMWFEDANARDAWRYRRLRSAPV